MDNKSVTCNDCGAVSIINIDQSSDALNYGWMYKTKNMELICPMCVREFNKPSQTPIQQAKTQIKDLKLQRRRSFNMLEKSIGIISTLVSLMDSNTVKADEALKFAKECEELIG